MRSTQANNSSLRSWAKSAAFAPILPSWLYLQFCLLLRREQQLAAERQRIADLKKTMEANTVTAGQLAAREDALLERERQFEERKNAFVSEVTNKQVRKRSPVSFWARFLWLPFLT